MAQHMRLQSMIPHMDLLHPISIPLAVGGYSGPCIDLEVL